MQLEDVSKVLLAFYDRLQLPEAEGMWEKFETEMSFHREDVFGALDGLNSEIPKIREISALILVGTGETEHSWKTEERKLDEFRVIIKSDPSPWVRCWLGRALRRRGIPSE